MASDLSNADAAIEWGQIAGSLSEAFSSSLYFVSLIRCSHCDKYYFHMSRLNYLCNIDLHMHFKVAKSLTWL